MHHSFQVTPAELEAVLCACPLVRDAGVTSVYSNEHASELPRAYVVPVDENLLGNGLATKAQLQFIQEVKKYVESHTARYKWYGLQSIEMPVLRGSATGFVVVL